MANRFDSPRTFHEHGWQGIAVIISSMNISVYTHTLYYHKENWTSN